MGRSVILGNGSLTVGLDSKGLVHDFYYPYVGLENLTTARSIEHMIGVWVDGKFSWINDGSWDVKVEFEASALISNISMRSEALGLELYMYDFVASDKDIFCRNITVKNDNAAQREVRVFMHQVFEISRAGRADTALYEPDEKYILDYKGHVSLLIGGRNANGEAFDQFAVGNYGVEGKLGTYKDAEDGILSGSAVEHAGVDSVIGFTLQIKGFEETSLDYWIIASDSNYSAQTLHRELLKNGLQHTLKATRKYWNNWLDTSALARNNIAAPLKDVVARSLLIIKSHIDKRGGIIASCDSSIYNYGRDYYSYVWPRDGAYALWPLIRLGYKDEAKKFFKFCSDIMHSDGYMLHKYQPDKAVGSTWHPVLHGKLGELAIQEDETAIVLFMLGEYLDYTKDTDFVRSLYIDFVKPAADFMSRFVDGQTGLPHASYDLWEEKFLTHTYTTAVTYKALLVAADLAKQFGDSADADNWQMVASTMIKNQDVFYNDDQGMWRKGYILQESGDLTFDNTLDTSSWYGAFMYDYYSDKTRITNGAKKIESDLLNSGPSGGVPRYEYDGYFKSNPAYKGNPWIVTTLWLAQYYIRIGNTKAASELIQWCLQHTGPSGMLPEQVNPESGAPTGVSPLIWSHAELVNTILDISA